jgi:hypothetical protein
MRSEVSFIHYIRVLEILLISSLLSANSYTATSQISRVEVLSLISGGGTESTDHTVLREMIIDSVGRNIVCVFNTNEITHPVSEDAYMKSFPAEGNNHVYLAVYDLALTKMLYATYIAGTGTDLVRAACIDTARNQIIIVGGTDSDDFPVTSNARQKRLKGEVNIWYARMDLDSYKYEYITYLGGSEFDDSRSVVITKDRRLIITGISASRDLPRDPSTITRAPASEGEAAVFMIQGDSLEQVIYFGGISDERFIHMHETEDSFVLIGDTWSSDLLVTPDAFQKSFGGVSDLFILRTDKQFREIRYCSYLGGATNDMVNSSVSKGDRVHIVGETNGSMTYPRTHSAYGEDTLGAYNATYAIYDVGNNEIVFSALFCGPYGESIYDVFVLDKDRAILTMGSSSDSFLGIEKIPQGDYSVVMDILLEFDLHDYKPVKLHYLWNTGLGAGLDMIRPSPFGLYFSGYTERQIPVNPNGLQSHHSGGFASYVGRIHMSTDDVGNTQNLAPQLFSITPYPNPAGLNASVILTGPMGSYDLRLSNLEGRLISSFRIVHTGENATTISLPLTGLAAGRYLLVAHDAAGTPVARSAVLVQ